MSYNTRWQIESGVIGRPGLVPLTTSPQSELVTLFGAVGVKLGPLSASVFDRSVVRVLPCRCPVQPGCSAVKTRLSIDESICGLFRGRAAVHGQSAIRPGASKGNWGQIHPKCVFAGHLYLGFSRVNFDWVGYFDKHACRASVGDLIIERYVPI